MDVQKVAAESKSASCVLCKLRIFVVSKGILDFLQRGAFMLNTNAGKMTLGAEFLTSIALYGQIRQLFAGQRSPVMIEHVCLVQYHKHRWGGGGGGLLEVIDFVFTRGL